jgi:D-alanyl-D-alanine carboxypeptidase
MLETQVGVEKGAVFFDDASGLSPFNLTTPRAVARLLEWSLERPWKESFLRALATPGKGTLAAWPVLPAGVAAKTGTVQNTLGLAGYLSPRGSSPTIFVVFWNQTPENRGALRRDIAAIVNRYGN